VGLGFRVFGFMYVFWMKYNKCRVRSPKVMDGWMDGWMAFPKQQQQHP
jgi:hypothetical protein